MIAQLRQGRQAPHRHRVVEDEPEFSAEDFIVAEDNHVLLTRGRLGQATEGDQGPGVDAPARGRPGADLLGRAPRAPTVVFFSNFGTAYTCRIIDVPATTGYGEPIQKLFKLKDGERIVAALLARTRASSAIIAEEEGHYPETYAVAATSDGYALCFGLSAFVEPSTRCGRRYARPSKEAKVVGVEAVHGDEILLAATRRCRVLLCSVGRGELPFRARQRA